ncbi:MAG: AmmeMemoRadiSam system protein A [Nanoarchaeota archaeon]|nr:AmmeMemoRadiSam system protein A [Nanoarchaeota archaeon]
MLTKEQGRELVDLAKQAIRGKVSIPKLDFLEEKKGVFVTLTIKGVLRGCIGLPFPTTKLGKAVVEAARSAAFKDPRFPELKPEEYDEVSVEVSVLSKAVKCELEDIRKGDGVILEHSGRSALFLPQVWEELPDKTMFLEQLSMKALLSHNAYQTADFKKFSVQYFK